MALIALHSIMPMALFQSARYTLFIGSETLIPNRLASTLSIGASSGWRR